MSSEALYEQYKDALKRGHVAALRGRVEEALLAYAEAARIAPERSTPHASAGTALLRRKRPAEALRHYEVAIKIAPRDEVALLGRAQALAALDRRGDAADAFDALADVQAGSGRLADAVDAARRGLEMAEGRERRRTLERLIAKLRASEPGEPGRVALERALQVLDGVAVPQAAPSSRKAAAPAAGSAKAAGSQTAASATGTSAGGAAGAAKRDGPPLADQDGSPLAAGQAPGTASPASDAPAEGAEAEVAAATAVPAGDLTGAVAAIGPETEGAEDQADAGAAAPETELASAPSDAGPESGAANAEPGAATLASDAPPSEPAVPEPEPTLPAPREIPEGATAAEFAARAEAVIETGVPAQAVDALLDLAALHARDGHIDAALDACYSAVTYDPDNVALHLALAELYGARGWTALVTEKLALLQRLGELDADQAALADIAGVRTALG